MADEEHRHIGAGLGQGNSTHAVCTRPGRCPLRRKPDRGQTCQWYLRTALQWLCHRRERRLLPQQSQHPPLQPHHRRQNACHSRVVAVKPDSARLLRTERIRHRDQRQADHRSEHTQCAGTGRTLLHVEHQGHLPRQRHPGAAGSVAGHRPQGRPADSRRAHPLQRLPHTTGHLPHRGRGHTGLGGQLQQAAEGLSHA